MIAKIDLKPTARPLPADLADVALIDAQTCAAGGGMSVSWWHEKVRAGRAPAPAVRMSRCTRWKLSAVAAFWRDFAAKAAGDTHAAAQVTARAKKASAEARKPEVVAKAYATRAAKKAAATAVAS